MSNDLTPGEGRPKRMSLSEIVERLLERGGGEHSSVTLGRTAKGETTIEVVVRTGDRGEVTSIEDAETVAVETYDRLRTLYPMLADANAAGEGGTS